MKIKIDQELRCLLPPLASEQITELHESIRKEGCRDPLVLWDNGANHILIDGHNRYEFCEAEGIPYSHVVKTLADIPDRNAAADWIDRNQLSRRNLSPDEFKLVLGRRYERVKKTIPNPDGAGGKSGKIVGYQNDTGQSGKTRQRLAKEHGVGEATVQRAARYARAVETVKQIDPDIEEKIHAKEAPPMNAIISAAKSIEAKKISEAKDVLGRGVGAMKTETLAMDGKGKTSPSVLVSRRKSRSTISHRLMHAIGVLHREIEIVSEQNWKGTSRHDLKNEILKLIKAIES